MKNLQLLAAWRVSFTEPIQVSARWTETLQVSHKHSFLPIFPRTQIRTFNFHSSQTGSAQQTLTDSVQLASTNATFEQRRQRSSGDTKGHGRKTGERLIGDDRRRGDRKCRRRTGGERERAGRPGWGTPHSLACSIQH